MSELPITKKDYDRSARIVSFVREVKRITESSQQISGVLFSPVIKGYEVEYRNNGVSEKLSVNSKCRFFKGLIVKKYVDGKLKRVFRLKENEIGTEAINKILF